MHIDLECGFDIGMAEDLAQRFGVRAAGDTACSKGMTECVEIPLPQAVSGQEALKAVLQCARLHWLTRTAYRPKLDGFTERRF